MTSTLLSELTFQTRWVLVFSVESTGMVRVGARLSLNINRGRWGVGGKGCGDGEEK